MELLLAVIILGENREIRCKWLYRWCFM